MRCGDTVIVLNMDTADFQTSTVQYVTMMHYSGPLVFFKNSGLIVTPRHPVWINHEWRYPINMVDDENVVLVNQQPQPLVVYNFVLSDRNVALIVNDVPCVTFGHNIKEVWHDFYASDDVRKAIVAWAGDNHNSLERVNIDNLRKYSE